MTHEQFLEHFEQFAGAPNAIKEMRRLVLYMAVSGQLVTQDPDDEPAEKLVTRVSSRLPQKKSLNPFVVPIEPSITDESEFELPNGWIWLPLGNFGIWATGCGFPKKYQGDTGKEYLFCKVSDMNLKGNEVEIRDTVNSIDAEVMNEIRARSNPIGTVIFPKIGGAIATHKRRLVTRPTIIDNNCSGIQPIGLTENMWLLLMLQSIDLTRYQSGTSVPAVSQSSINPIRIGLPPLAEQKRIVAKVDELMALCDQLEAQQAERDAQHKQLTRAARARFNQSPTPKNLNLLFHKSYNISPDELRETILTLAIQGKLVTRDPDDQPARVLYENIQLDREEQTAAGVYKSSKPLPNISEDEEPFTLPQEWMWARLRSLAYTLGDGLHGTPEYCEGTDFHFINGNNLINGQIVIKANTKTVSVEEAQKYRKPMTTNTVLVSINGTLGNVAFYNHEKVMLGKSACYFTLPYLVDKHFIRRLIESPLFRAYATNNSTGTTIRNLGLKAMNLFTVPLPPLNEQRRIAAKVDELMALVDQLEAQLEESRDTATELMEAVVAELTA